jgi:hypothetical protein
MQTRVRVRAALLIVVALFAAEIDAQPKPPEYQVKAAFLFKFATYIRWPPRTGTEAASPFVICVVGKDPFGKALDIVVRDQNVQGRPIQVHRVAAYEEARRCDLLFVSASERSNVQQIFDALRGSPVLTVGDMDHFAERGGMVNLVITDDNQIRFDINKESVERAGLRAPSQLLRLARIVQSQTGGE